MSKYEDEQFANMKICLFLIIGFTNFVNSCDLNITHDSQPVCAFNFFRSKRDAAEYTRWQANLETTPEFIVKILDEDFSTTRSKKVVAVNIQTVTKGIEKIIIGGAMVPPPTTVPTTSTLNMEMQKEYTRFVPPTTTSAVLVQGNVYVAPIAKVSSPAIDIDQFIAMLPSGKNPQRDESPPAGPHFLNRNPLGPRQYAPITPVGFTRRTMLGPMTPPATSTKNFRRILTPNDLTSSLIDLLISTKMDKEADELRDFIAFGEDHESGHITTEHTPTFQDEYSTELETTTKKQEIEDYSPVPLQQSNENDKNIHKKDSDITYNSIFYSYDDNESSKKKSDSGQDSVDNYLDKLKDQNRDHEHDTDDDPIRKSDDSSNIKPVQLDDEEDDLKEESDNSMDIPIKIKVRPSPKTDKLVSRKTTFRKKPKMCSMIKPIRLNFDSPMTLYDIVLQLKIWAETSPIAKWIDITEGNYTNMENPVYMMMVDDPSSGQIITAKNTVMIVAGIQGRDHHAVASAMYVLHHLIDRSSGHGDLLAKNRFWVIPVFNPDGYDYSMTFPHRREWTKNLRQSWVKCKTRKACGSCEAYGLRCTIKPCYGVHLDRNFEYQWIPTEELRAEHPCGPLHAGERQLSEAETNAFTKYMHDNRSPISTFIAFKEGEILGVMYPYSHTKKKRAFDPVYRQRASRAASAAYSINGRPYTAGQTSESLPLYAGGMEDWVEGHLGIDNTYTIMMHRPADTYNSKLKMERVVQEAYAAMDTLVMQGKGDVTALAHSRIHKRSSTQTITASATLHLTGFLLLLLKNQT